MYSHRMNWKGPSKLYPVRWSQSSQGEGRWKDEARNYPMNLSVMYAGDPLTLRKMWKYSLPATHTLFYTIVVHTDRTIKLSSGRLCFVLFLICSYWLWGGGKGRETSMMRGIIISCLLHGDGDGACNWNWSMCPERNGTATPWFIGLRSTTEPSRPGRTSLIWPRIT